MGQLEIVADAAVARNQANEALIKDLVTALKGVVREYAYRGGPVDHVLPANRQPVPEMAIAVEVLARAEARP